VYELFLQHRRKFTVARILNEKGYRKGRLWEEIQIKDMLTDSSAKGVCFFNRESWLEVKTCTPPISGNNKLQGLKATPR
jgi:hypothetical protein